VVLAGPKIVLTRGTGDEVHAFTAVCTHLQCTVANVSGGTINCNCHGSKFDATTGAVVQNPATKPLSRIPVTVVDGSIRKA
jgi:Rieske Fe-S protein